MAEFWALMHKVLARSSTVWRLLWLVFCLVVICLAGAPALRWVVPYVLAGIGDQPSTPLLPKKADAEPPPVGPFLTWVLPTIFWILGAACVIKQLFFP
ncbi:hypothetical protein ACFY36_31525 [Actinoplanes sp. NPDC000266]